MPNVKIRPLATFARRSAKPALLTHEQAETIAAHALEFLAKDQARLVRFVALSGVEPGDFARQVTTAPMQAAILDHLLSDESLLLLFTADTGVDPASIAPAAGILAGFTATGDQ